MQHKNSVNSGAQLCHQAHSFSPSFYFDLLSQLSLRSQNGCHCSRQHTVMTSMAEKGMSLPVLYFIWREEIPSDTPFSLVIVALYAYTFLDHLVSEWDHHDWLRLALSSRNILWATYIILNCLSHTKKKSRCYQSYYHIFLTPTYLKYYFNI